MSRGERDHLVGKAPPLPNCSHAFSISSIKIVYFVKCYYVSSLSYNIIVNEGIEIFYLRNFNNLHVMCSFCHSQDTTSRVMGNNEGTLTGRERMESREREKRERERRERERMERERRERENKERESRDKRDRERRERMERRERESKTEDHPPKKGYYYSNLWREGKVTSIDL